MRKLITLLIIVLSFYACNDGDFDIPEFEFTEDVFSCGEYLLYKKSQSATESMVLILSDDQIGSELGDASYPISSTLPVNYRIFNEGIGSDYYCMAIPPVGPTVLKELNALSGDIHILTAEIISDGILEGYSYEISISDLLFMDGDERIYFENFYFGIFTLML